MANFDLRRSFLYLLIASVAVSAVFAIAVILFGDFGDFEVRVMMTTLTLTAASILGLACGAAIEAGKARIHPYAGIAAAILSALALFLIIWNVFDDYKIYIKSTMTVVIVAVVCSHLSLLALARLDAIEGCGMDFMEQLNARVQGIALFSETHDDLSATIFAESQPLAFDSTGRIQLPEALRAHAGITDKATFVGMGTLFQIWEPARLAGYKTAARQRVRERQPTLPPLGHPGDGGGR